MIMVYRNHIRAEKEEWKTPLEINMLFKMINEITGRKLNRTDLYLFQLIIHILNLLTKLSLFLCFSFYCFTVLWKHFKSEFTVYLQFPMQEVGNTYQQYSVCIHLKVGYGNCKIFYITKFTSVLPLIWLVQAIQKLCHSATSPWSWLLYQSKHWKNWNKLG